MNNLKSSSTSMPLWKLEMQYAQAKRRFSHAEVTMRAAERELWDLQRKIQLARSLNK